MVAIFGFTREKVIAAVQEMYTSVAVAPERPYHFPVGRDACRRVGYPEVLLEGLAEEALRAFAGVGCPFRAEVIRAGDTVLDIGAGAGTDTLIAARLAGPRGRIFALDITPAMARRLRELVTRHGIANVEVIEGNAEEIPLPAASIDVVTSNGMLNLVPDKRKAVAEIFRVLRPGGHVQIADIVIRRPVTLDCATDPKLWAECVVGASIHEDYLAMFSDAGFKDLTVLRDHDYFALSPSEETRHIAHRFGAHAIEFVMQRGATAPSKLVQLLQRADPRRMLRALARRGLAGTAALVLSFLACYGTLAVTALLSLAGVTLAINPALWAGTIVVFGALSAAAVAAGVRLHRGYAAPGFAVGGAAALTYVQFVDYSARFELVAFVLLAAGVALDILGRRKSEAALARAASGN
ncbi:MAG TPA: methyltransferase domain-containing protein [Burkholderiales bacterium]